MKNQRRSACTKCPVEKEDRICRTEGGKGPAFCPTKNYGKIIERATKEYEKAEVREFGRVASLQEAEGYSDDRVPPYVRRPVKPRLQEICEFAKKMGYKKLGVAFCGGLSTEAQALTNVLEAQGFEVASVCCKVGRVPKGILGFRDEDQNRINPLRSMCNPIVQAAILNAEKTEFNILVGLCVGHDSLFLKYSEAFCTVFIVKDRVLGHNPAAAVYTLGSYSKRMLRPGF